jgi:putative transcriptional regulator
MSTHNPSPSVAPFNLSGQVLVAMPSLVDPNFQGAVVYICEHSQKGAMGLLINRPAAITVNMLFDNIDIVSDPLLSGSVCVFSGGPVANERGFVLHRGDKTWQSTLKVDIEHDIYLTTSRDILEAVGQGLAPEHWCIYLGYTGWSEGQLERELAANAWFHAPASPKLLFDTPPEERLTAAYAMLGIHPAQMSGVAGRA